MALVSVIIPVYNVEDFLETCVNSVINQSVKDIEIILVNDGSNDSSGIISNSLAALDNRIKVVHKKNKGPSSARNTGIQLAKGEYISFIDSDDWIEPLFLERLYSLASKNNADIVNTGITVEFLKENKVETIRYNEEICLKDKAKFGLFFMELHKLKLSNYPVTRLFKRTFLLENKILFETGIHVGEDLIFNLEAFKCANSICINNLALYHYMKRELLTLTSSYQANLSSSNQIILEAYKNFFNYFSMQDKEHSDFLNLLYIKLANSVVVNLYKKNSNFTSTEKALIIEEELFSDLLLSKKLRQSNLKNYSNKLFKFLLVNTNSKVMEMIYRTIFYFRNKYEGIYLRLRYLLRI